MTIFKTHDMMTVGVHVYLLPEAVAINCRMHYNFRQMFCPRGIFVCVGGHAQVAYASFSAAMWGRCSQCTACVTCDSKIP